MLTFCFQKETLCLVVELVVCIIVCDYYFIHLQKVGPATWPNANPTLANLTPFQFELEFLQAI